MCTSRGLCTVLRESHEVLTRFDETCIPCMYIVIYSADLNVFPLEISIQVQLLHSTQDVFSGCVARLLIQGNWKISPLSWQQMQCA